MIPVSDVQFRTIIVNFQIKVPVFPLNLSTSWGPWKSLILAEISLRGFNGNKI